MARLVAHRRRQVDAAIIVFERERERVRVAESALRATDAALIAARSGADTYWTAGTLAERDTYLRTLLLRQMRARAHHAALLRTQQQAHGAVIQARVELKKVEILLDNLERQNAEDEARAVQRTTDDRVGSKGARESA